MMKRSEVEKQIVVPTQAFFDDYPKLKAKAKRGIMIGQARERHHYSGPHRYRVFWDHRGAVMLVERRHFKVVDETKLSCEADEAKQSCGADDDGTKQA